MLKKLGFPVMALAAMLMLFPPSAADAKVHWGVGVGIGAPVYGYSPYYPPYYYSPYYDYPYYYPYGYAPSFGIYGGWGGHGWSGHGWGHEHFHGGGHHH